MLRTKIASMRLIDGQPHLVAATNVVARLEHFAIPTHRSTAPGVAFAPLWAAIIWYAEARFPVDGRAYKIFAQRADLRAEIEALWLLSDESGEVFDDPRCYAAVLHVYATWHREVLGRELDHAWVP